MSKETKNKKGTFIHGIGASEHLDSSGERIKIKGIDISSLTKDGVFNFEHQSKEASSIVGKVIEAKKILKEDDCENKHHKYFWNKIKKPFLYVAGELFDADGHQAAKDVAAMLRYDTRNKDNKETKKLVNFSIEGQKLENDGGVITKCIARKMSITITPCNKVCEAELLDPKDIENGEKMKKFGDHESNFSFVQDLMSKNEGHFASCEPIYKDEFTPSVKPDTGYGKIINVSKPKKENYGKVIGVGNKPKENYGKVIKPTSSKPKKEGFGKVIVKSDEKKKKKDGRYDPGRKAPKKHGHHTVPVGESAEHADWHLRNLWETPDKKGGYRTVKDMDAKEHVKLHADRRRKQVKKSDDEIPFPLGKSKHLEEPKPEKTKDKKLEKDDAPDQLYHIRYQGNRITNKPKSLKEIQQIHGNVKELESKGYRLVHQDTAKKTIGKTEDIIEKFEFFNRIGNRFNQYMKRRAIDQTAKKLQGQREAQGQEFDPDATVMADKKGVTLGSGKKPVYQPKNRTRFLFPKDRPSDEELLNPKVHLEEGNKIVDPVLARKWKTHDEQQAHKKDMQSFQDQERLRATRTGSIDEKTAKIGKSINIQNNMRKALTAGSMMGAPGTLTQGAALQKEHVEGAKKTKKKKKKTKKSIATSTENDQPSFKAKTNRFTKSDKYFALKELSDEAFEQFEKKEELINFLLKNLPNRSEKELMALAKTVAYVHLKKKEIKLSSLLKSFDDEGGDYDYFSMLPEGRRPTGMVFLNAKHITQKPATKLEIEHYKRDIDANNHFFDNIYDKNNPDHDALADAWEDHVNRIQDRLESSLQLLEKEKKLRRRDKIGLKVVKSEEVLETLQKSKNVREQRRKVFGTNAMPAKSSKMHGKHMDSIGKFVKDFLGLELKPSGGKLDEETGERRHTKKGKPQVGTDKPDWRSGDLEAQWNPDAAIHELGHLFLLPKGVGIEDAQKLMDKQYSDVQAQYGYQQQKRSKYETEPMAAEQIIRRVIGLPATEHDAPTGYEPNPEPGKPAIKRYEKDDPRKTSVEDPEKEIALRLPKSQMRQGREAKRAIQEKRMKMKQSGDKTKEKLAGQIQNLQNKLAGYEDEHHDLVRLSRNLSPENRQTLYRRLSRQEVFHPVHGWHDANTPDAKINQRVEESQPNPAPEDPVKKSEELAKAKVYDLASRKMIADTDVQSNDKVRSHLQEIQDRKRAEDPFADLDHIQTTHKKIAARFGGSPPQTLLDAMKISEGGGYDEPYAFGDINNVVYSTVNDRVSEGRWNRPMPMPMRVNPEKMKGHLGKRVGKGGSDPFAWMDQKYRISHSILKENRDNPLKISTRSDLIAHDDYIKHLNPKKHSVEMHVFGDNDMYNRVIEPGAPSFKRRMKAVKKLRDAGIPVTIVHDKLPFDVMDDKGFNRIQQPLGVDVRQNIINPKNERIKRKILSNMSKVSGIDLLGMAGGKKK